MAKFIVKPTPAHVYVYGYPFRPPVKREGAEKFEYQFAQPYSLRDLNMPVVKTTLGALDMGDEDFFACVEIIEEKREWLSIRKNAKAEELTREIIKIKPIEKQPVNYVLLLASVGGKSTFKSGKWISNKLLATDEVPYSRYCCNRSPSGAHWYDIWAVFPKGSLRIVSEGNTPHAKGTIDFKP